MKASWWGVLLVTMFIYIHLYSPYNMVAQANKTGTNNNTTNEKIKKNDDCSTPHT